jgi:hypothetical protein
MKTTCPARTHANPVSTVLVTIYSNLGLLVLAEQLSKALNVGGLVSEPETHSKMLQYQFTSISSIVTMVKSMFALPFGDGPEISTQLAAGTSLMLDHVNLGLVILALTKSTEHSLHLQEAALLSPTAQQVHSDPEHQSPWSDYIKTLIKCLISLDKTIVGAFPARVALNGLLRKYGDIIMESWSPEYECEPQPQSNIRAPTPHHRFDQGYPSAQYILA